MTYLELIKYYADLLIIQYRSKPKFYAVIKLLAEMGLSDKLPEKVQNAFDLETAIGNQLDILGKYAGVSRSVYDFSGPVTLSDDNLRLLIQIKIILNQSDSSLKSVQDLLFSFFPGIMRVIDYKDMSISYVFESEFGNEQLAEVFVKSGFLPRPTGVRMRTPIYSPSTDKFFAYRTYGYTNPNGSPYNTYDSYELDRPFLKYEDGLN